MRHSIRREKLNVNVATQEAAWDLQPRLRDFNRNHLLPVIERVLDDLAVEGRQIRVPALRLDLGHLPLEGFEALAAERLDHELRKALAEAIAGANRNSASRSQSQSEDESQLNLLEHYLQFGNLPFWGMPATAFSLETALLELMQRDPAGVLRLLRRIGSRPWAVQRLVFQLSESTLERLLNLLRPQAAARIIAGMLELRDIQREITVSAVDEREFFSLLWVSALTYLFQNTTSPFDHRSFVRYQLCYIADHESSDLHELLFSLERVVTRLEKGHLLDATLPSIIRELVREEKTARAGSLDEPLPAAEKLVSPSDSFLPAVIGEVVGEGQIAGDDSSAHEALRDSRDLAQPSIAGVPGLAEENVLRATIRGLPGEEQSDEQITREASADDPLQTSKDLVHPLTAEIPSLTEESILALIKKLLPQTEAAASVFWTALMAHAAGAQDKRAFYSGVLAAIQEGRIVDLEELKASPSDEPLSASENLVSASDPTLPAIIGEVVGEGQIAGDDSSAHEALRDSRDLAQPSIAGVPGLAEENVLRATIRGLPGEEQSDEQITREASADDPLQTSKDLVHPLTAEIPSLTEESILALIKKLLPQTEAAANVFWTALMAHAAGAQDKRAFYSGVLAAIQEGRIVDLEELSKTSHEERAIFPHLEEPGEELEHTAEHQVRRPVDQSAADVETQSQIPHMPPDVRKRLAREQELQQRGRERLRAHATRARSAFSMDNAQPSLPVGEPIYIDNAGLVLTTPFLPMLFNSLNMLRKDENGKSHWPDQETASRGVHLLQYLVNERVNAPEPLLALNKLLCGLPVAMPVEKSITMTNSELAACEKLLRSMLANWKALSGTSIAGLRETFLQRQGRLEQSDAHWKLQVQRKTVDVLVDQVPWSISVIFHGWMRGPIHVTW